jgi:hypothetical protein
MQFVKAGQANTVSADLNDGTSAITTGAVQHYLRALTGSNAGKWWTGSAWAATETAAGSGTSRGRGHWDCSIAEAAWTVGVVYQTYAVHDGGIQIHYRDEVFVLPAAGVAIVPTDSTVVQICNAALQFIGAARITTLTDGTREADAAAFWWPLIRKTVFCAVPWKCITKRVILEDTDTAPAWGFAYAYTLPSDYLRLVRLLNGDDEYRVVGTVLHTDLVEPEIEYIYDCDDPSLYSPDLVRCLYLNLAYELAYCLTQNTEVGDRVKADLEKFFLPIVRFNNSIGAGLETPKSDTLTDMFW